MNEGCAIRGANGGDTRAQGNTLEDLVEENDNEEGDEETVTRNDKRQTNQERVEDDTHLHDQDTNRLAGEQSAGALLSSERRLGTNLVLDDSMPDILHHEGQEDTSHDNGGGGGLVLHLADTRIRKHQVRVSVQVDEGSGDDDTRAKLLEDSEDQAELGVAWEHLVDEDRAEDTEGGSSEDDEKKADAEADVVVTIAGGAGRVTRAAAFG